MNWTVVSESRCFEGTQGVYTHASQATDSTMRLAVYRPPVRSGARLPVLFWLSGLTCTEENFVVKAGAQRIAAELGMIVVAPDTSPRVPLPGDAESYDFGAGASFYLDATVAPWSRHYRMETYVADELPEVIAAHFPIDMGRIGIFGHSMGGHGALALALKHPARFRTVSAFAPIASLLHAPWGRKALAGYLGEDVAAWQEHDVASLIRSRRWQGPPLLVDQGMADAFLDRELQPERLAAACVEAGVPITLNRREGYDHSYFFIATFMASHLAHHAAFL
ncbi:MAG: S-formylglutathione hydrolase [Casimicrobiaceae bacterium]